MGGDAGDVAQHDSGLDRDDDELFLDTVDAIVLDTSSREPRELIDNSKRLSAMLPELLVPWAYVDLAHPRASWLPVN